MCMYNTYKFSRDVIFVLFMVNLSSMKIKPSFKIMKHIQLVITKDPKNQYHENLFYFNYPRNLYP